jgi:hypothetical protein
MKKYLIERLIPQVGSLEPEQYCAAAKRSNEVIDQLGHDIQWVQSYVAADRLFCIYYAKNEAIIQQHAAISGFPANRITEIPKLIDPTTAKSDDQQKKAVA